MSIATWTAGVLVLCAHGVFASQAETPASQDKSSGKAKQERVDEAALIREALAAAVVKAQAERDLAGALAALEPLPARAAMVGDAKARGNLLVQIAVERAKVLQELGRNDEALAATRELAPASLLLAVGLDAAELERLAGDARLVAVRSQLAPAMVAEEPAIETTVRNAVNAGHGGLVVEIGARAAPVLEAMALESVEQLPSPSGDALVYLFEVSERRGARFVLERFDAGGFFWKKRIVRAMRESQVLTNEGTWSGQAPQAEVLREPEWLDVLEKLLRDPLARRDAAQLSAEIVQRDAVTPNLTQGLVDALFSGDPDTERDVVQALDQTWGCPTAIPVLEAALKHADPHVRRIAAERLAGFPFSAGLRTATRDRDPQVRMQLVMSLQDHTRPRSTRERQFSGPPSLPVNPTLRPEDEAVLAELLADEDPRIVARALRAYIEEPSFTPPAPRLIEIARSGSVDARRSLTMVERIGREDLARVLEILAVDPAWEVRNDVDERLEKLCEEDPVPYLAAVRARLPLLPSDHSPERHNGQHRNPPRYPKNAVQTPEGARTLFHDALRRGDDALVRSLFFHLDEPRSALRWLDAEDQELLFRKGEALGVLANLRNEMDDWGPLPVDILLKVLQDDTASRPTRASAASLLALVHDPRIDEELAAFLTDETWGRTPPSSVEQHTLNLLKMRSILEGDGSSPVLLAAIRSPSLHDSVLAAFLPDGTSRALAPDVLMRMKGKRWDPVYWYNELNLLEAPLPGPVIELLVELLKEPGLTDVVAETMGRQMRPTFVEPLKALVLGPDGPDTSPKMRAVEALGAYLDDRTADILLEAVARTSSEEIREVCFAKLETIRRYQDERACWDGRATDKAARDGAVRELLAMLGDPAPAVRAQAARSLATLEAVEALPKIVALLKDADAKVREAANEALKSLNAPPGAKSEPKTETKKP